MVAVSSDLSFFDNMAVFTYAKVEQDILPCDIETVRYYYPHKPDYDKFSHYKIPSTALSAEFLDILDRGGLAVKHAEVFYRPGTGAAMDSFIHTDGHRVVPGFAKVNYVLGGDQNIMKWWRPLAVTEKNNMETAIGTKYLRFEEHECVLLDSVDLHGLYVVNAGIPHSVTMSSGSVSEPRICISVTPILKTTRDNLGCRDTLSRLHYALKNK